MRTHDLVVIGAGVLGCAHALEALGRGLDVVVLDREARAVGASVRNFGHVCTTAQPRSLQPLARVSREGWLAAASRVGLIVHQHGTVVLAATSDELGVLEELAAERGREVVMLTPAEVAARLGREPGPIVGGAHLLDDLRVDPRTTVGALAAYIDAHARGEVRWSTAYLGSEEYDDPDDATGKSLVRVRTTRGELLARNVIVCVGHDVDHSYPEIAAKYEIERCTLAMMRLSAPTGVAANPIGPGILTSTSLGRYGAFTEQPSAPAVLAGLAERSPHLLTIEANVMATQLPDGSLIVGDTHDQGVSAWPFVSQSAADAVEAEFRQLTGITEPVIERWQGVYAISTKQSVVDVSVAPNVRLVTVTSGIGMTLAFGLARRTLGRLHPLVCTA